MAGDVSPGPGRGLFYQCSSRRLQPRRSALHKKRPNGTEHRAGRGGGGLKRTSSERPAERNRPAEKEMEERGTPGGGEGKANRDRKASTERGAGLE